MVPERCMMKSFAREVCVLMGRNSGVQNSQIEKSTLSRVILEFGMFLGMTLNQVDLIYSIVEERTVLRPEG